MQHDPGSAPDSAPRLLSLFQILATILLWNAGYKGARVVNTLYALDLGAGPFDTGLLLAVYGVFPLVLAIHVGKISDRYGVRLHADWMSVRETAALRHRVAAAVLGVLLGKIDPASKGEVLVAFAMADLHKAIEADAFLKAEVADPVVAATR